MSARGWWIAGCVVGLLAVTLGAMGAHGMEKIATPEALTRWWEVGTRYAAYHAVALLAVAWVASRAPSRAASVAGWSFLAGVLLFSGSLWIMTPTGLRKLGMITPFGGIGFMLGWVALAVAGARALGTTPIEAQPATSAGAPPPARNVVAAQPAAPSFATAKSPEGSTP